MWKAAVLAALFLCGIALADQVPQEAPRKNLAQVAETAKEFIQCMVPLEHQVLLFGWQLGKSFEGTAVLIARVELGGETYDLWAAPEGTCDAGELVTENVKKSLLAVIEPFPGFSRTWLVGPRLVVTSPTNLTPLAALCPLSLPEDLEKPEQVVIVGFDERGGKMVRFVSFARPTIGHIWSFGYEGDLHWEHKRIDVAGALVLAWKGAGTTTQDFLPIGIYGPWEYTWKYMGQQNNEKKDVEPLLPGACKVTFSELPKGRAANIVRAVFGLELEPEGKEPELEW